MTKSNTANWKKHLYWIVPLLLVLWVVLTYNSLINTQVGVDTAWGQVQTVYQRRVDLIPNLIETVKGARDFEKGLLLEITQARSKWMEARTASEQVVAANGLDGALGRLMLIAENYPELKTNQNFLALQDELAGTENRISVERQRYNSAAGSYNAKIRRVPANIIAGLFRFEAREFFTAEKGAELAPKVKF